MKIYPIVLGACVLFLSSAATASAAVVLYAEGPASASVGSEVPVHIKARMTEPINALRMTVAVNSDAATFERFDDTDSVVRLWLQRGVQSDEGILLEGVIPGGVGPAFTDIADIGTIWLRPSAVGALRVSISDALVYLNQPTPTLSEVSTRELVIPVQSSESGASGEPYRAVVFDADVRIVSEAQLNNGARSVLFDIKTDRGTVDAVRIRERWLGLFGVWREVVSPSTLSDSWGVSILDVALSDSVGGARVASVVPLLLKGIWAAAALGVAVVIRRYLKKRH